jgi:hypothetical protein
MKTRTARPSESKLADRLAESAFDEGAEATGRRLVPDLRRPGRDRDRDSLGRRLSEGGDSERLRALAADADALADYTATMERGRP